MHPFGYGPVLATAVDYAKQKNISDITVAAIKTVNGNIYKVGSPYTLLCSFLKFCLFLFS
jgi:hypothetical protein